MLSTQEDLARTDRFRGCLLGLACGDALGTTVEFCPPGTFKPVTDMEGGGPFRLRPGEWTDDTSMALCLARSLLETGGFDPADQMERYVRWWRDGYLSSNGECFDIGGTVATALDAFRRTGEPFSGSTHPRSAGNGSIMRLAPVAMFFAPDREAAIHHVGESSRTTHACDEAVDACRLLAAMLHAALEGADKNAILGEAGAGLEGHAGLPLAPAIAAIARGDWREKDEGEIRGSGYVVHSLEAAVWCFAEAEGYADAVLRAVNLGEDADTTAAVCGQLAGAFYGASGIPEAWRAKLVLADEMAAWSDALRRV